MELTELEKKMLNGGAGKGVQYAMQILVKLGNLYGAKRFLPIKNAHIDAAAYTTIWDAGTDFLEFLVNNGAHVSVPTTINPMSVDRLAGCQGGPTAAFSAQCERLEKAYLKLGVIPTWTCAPYQCTNVPVFGENVGWSESNAVNYVNSVIGAHSERLPDLIDVCCAVAGRVPEYGLYIDENRAGELLIRLEGFDGSWFHDSVDYALLGYCVGEIAMNKVPVICGLPPETMPDDLKALSAAAASGGAVALFHAVGITPEAPTLKAAFHGREGYPTVAVTPETLRSIRAKLNSGAGKPVDAVLMGCPHLSAEEMKKIAALLNGRHVAEGTKLLLQTSHTIYSLSERAGIIKIITDAGAEIMRDSCLMEMEDLGWWRGKHIVTNSGKAAQYAPAILGVWITLANLRGCVDASITGRSAEI